MLTLGQQPFTTGRARFLDRDIGTDEGSAKIFVKIELEGFAGPVLAQLDTGFPWSILTAEIAEMLGLFSGSAAPVVIQTRLGRMAGHLERIQLVLPADDGASLELDAPMFISRDWSAGNFIGYSGFIDAIRIALDPQNNLIYFGPY